MTKDYNGKALNIGDIVTIRPNRSDKSITIYGAVSGRCTLLYNTKYTITSIEYSGADPYYDMIQVVHESTGLTSQWFSRFFVLMRSVKKEHKDYYPTWF